MDCYEVLGIAADADKRSIKRAYSSLIKVHTPDQHPEEFQRIKDAYDEALERLENPVALPVEGLSDSTDTDISEANEPEVDPQLADFQQQFDAALNALFEQEDYREWHKGTWANLLTHPALESLSLKQQLRYMVYQRLDYYFERNYIRIAYPFNLPEELVTDFAQALDWKDYEDAQPSPMAQVLEHFYYPESKADEFIPDEFDHVEEPINGPSDSLPDLLTALRLMIYLGIFIYLVYVFVTSGSYMLLVVYCIYMASKIGRHLNYFSIGGK